MTQIDKNENFIFRALDKLNAASNETKVVVMVSVFFMCVTLAAIGITGIIYFAPRNLNSVPHPTPAMKALISELRDASFKNKVDMEKYYIQKIMELEQKESLSRQIIVNQIAPVTSIVSVSK